MITKERKNSRALSHASQFIVSLANKKLKNTAQFPNLKSVKLILKLREALRYTSSYNSF